MNQNEAYQVNHGYVKCPHCDLYIHQIVDKARESESKSCQEALKQMNEAYNEDLKLSRLTLIREIRNGINGLFKAKILNDEILTTSFLLTKKDIESKFVKIRFLRSFEKATNIEQRKNLARKLFSWFWNPSNRMAVKRLRKGKWTSGNEHNRK